MVLARARAGRHLKEEIQACLQVGMIPQGAQLSPWPREDTGALSVRPPTWKALHPLQALRTNEMDTWEREVGGVGLAGAEVTGNVGNGAATREGSESVLDPLCNSSHITPAPV